MTPGLVRLQSPRGAVMFVHSKGHGLSEHANEQASVSREIFIDRICRYLFLTPPHIWASSALCFSKNEWNSVLSIDWFGGKPIPTRGSCCWVPTRLRRVPIKQYTLVHNQHACVSLTLLTCKSSQSPTALCLIDQRNPCECSSAPMEDLVNHSIHQVTS